MNASKDLNEYFHYLQEHQKEKHDDLLKNTLSKVDSIRYSKTVLVELYPFENEIFGLDKGVELKESDVINKDKKKSYFSKGGELIMTEDILANDKVTSRSFFNYCDDFIERISFQKIGVFKLKALSRFYNKSGRLINKGVMGEACWIFNYVNGFPISIHIEEKDNSSESLQRREVEFIYNEKKELREVINKYENGTGQVIYQRRK